MRLHVAPSVLKAGVSQWCGRSASVGSLRAGVARHGCLSNADVSLVMIRSTGTCQRGMEFRAKLSKTSKRTSTMKVQAPRTLLRRQLLAGGKRRAVAVPYRCFSCSIRHAQQQTPPPPPKSPQDGQGTTHFGFETVTEALKEQRGIIASHVDYKLIRLG